ncbi:hypothetical protein O6H91_21G019700 [Diphasiastrum complanatum]|uniref:Uncharacterized protein n=1 Tax=Diphasiastrum complanatum TaxID=34168 RepID=A0ACC2AII6_DIPCM|nr:hypothetical protein O6H91_21G019700 [Diphasiastrum complanatum]
MDSKEKQFLSSGGILSRRVLADKSRKESDASPPRSGVIVPERLMDARLRETTRREDLSHITPFHLQTLGVRLLFQFCRACTMRFLNSIRMLASESDVPESLPDPAVEKDSDGFCVKSRVL